MEEKKVEIGLSPLLWAWIALFGVVLTMHLKDIAASLRILAGR